MPDMELLEMLYKPDIATEIIEEKDSDEDEYNVFRIRVDDVVVRYVEEMSSITVTVEGELSPDIVEQLKQDTINKFAALERAPITCQIIPFE